MKIKDIIENLDKSDSNRVTDSIGPWDIEELDSDLYDMVSALVGDYGSQELQEWLNENITWFWITPWNCTDTWVGLSTMFYKGELMAILFQEGRKCDTNTQYTEVFNKFFDDYLSQAIKEVRNKNGEQLDLDKDIEELPLHYPFELLGNQALVDGKLSEMRKLTTAECQEQTGSNLNFHLIFADGKLVSNKEVDIKIPFNLTEQKFKEVYGE